MTQQEKQEKNWQIRGWVYGKMNAKVMFIFKFLYLYLLVLLLYLIRGIEIYRDFSILVY